MTYCKKGTASREAVPFSVQAHIFLSASGRCWKILFRLHIGAKGAQTKRGKRASTPNTSIRCAVTNCANHCKDAQYCGLNTIQVGTHEANPTMDQCTDCQSFKKQ